MTTSVVYLYMLYIFSFIVFKNKGYLLNGLICTIYLMIITFSLATLKDMYYFYLMYKLSNILIYLLLLIHLSNNNSSLNYKSLIFYYSLSFISSILFIARLYNITESPLLSYLMINLSILIKLIFPFSNIIANTYKGSSFLSFLAMSFLINFHYIYILYIYNQLNNFPIMDTIIIFSFLGFIYLPGFLSNIVDVIIKYKKYLYYNYKKFMYPTRSDDLYYFSKYHKNEIVINFDFFNNNPIFEYYGINITDKYVEINLIVIVIFFSLVRFLGEEDLLLWKEINLILKENLIFYYNSIKQHYLKILSFLFGFISMIVLLLYTPQSIFILFIKYFFLDWIQILIICSLFIYLLFKDKNNKKGII